MQQKKPGVFLTLIAERLHRYDICHQMVIVHTPQYRGTLGELATTIFILTVQLTSVGLL